PRDDAELNPQDRGQHAREERGFLAVEVHEDEQQQGEKTGSRPDQDDDPPQPDAILPDQVTAEDDRETAQGGDPDEDVRQHDQEGSAPEEVFQEREEPVHGTHPRVPAHEEQEPSDGRQEGGLVIGAHEVTVLGGSSGAPTGYRGGPRSTSGRGPAPG